MMFDWWRGLRRRTRLGLLALICVGLPSLVTAGFALWCDTPAGHAFVGRKIAATKFNNGLNVRVGGIEGSIFGVMQMKEVVLSDPSGEFAVIPHMTVAWRPARMIVGDLAIQELSAESVQLSRKPAFLTAGKDENSTLPFERIEIDRFAIARLEMEPGVTGKRHRASIDGSLVLKPSGVSVRLVMKTDRGDGLAGGDKVDLTIRPGRDGSRPDLNGTVSAPADGLLASMIDKPVPVSLTFGHGSAPMTIESVSDRRDIDELFKAMEADLAEIRP